MTEPKLTVLIPTFNRPKLLERAINSVTSQTYENIIIRVFDNGSDDETSSLMHSMCKTDQRIEYLRHKENIGAIGNFKILIDSVKTQYYLVISDDDCLMPMHIERGVNSLSEYPEAELYMGATITLDYINKTSLLRNQSWKDGFYNPSIEHTKKIISEHFTSTGTIFRSSIKKHMAGFHQLGLDDIFCIIATSSIPFYVCTKGSAVYTINQLRGVEYPTSLYTFDEILISGALDRKTVLELAPLEIRPLVLEYLDFKYEILITKKNIDFKKKFYKKKRISFVGKVFAASRWKFVCLRYLPYWPLHLVIRIRNTYKAFAIPMGMRGNQDNVDWESLERLQISREKFMNS
jgi:glycosyltransferase involved in cell wall biosynthesis